MPSGSVRPQPHTLSVRKPIALNGFADLVKTAVAIGAFKIAGFNTLSACPGGPHMSQIL